MTDLRLNLGEYLNSELDCADCILGQTPDNVTCAVKHLVDQIGVRQVDKGRPFFCSAYVPRRCTCGMEAVGPLPEADGCHAESAAEPGQEG